MNENKKPQAINLGHAIDGQSITDNYSDRVRHIGDHKNVGGESAPVMTIYDILERELLPDVDHCNSMDKASAHLKAQGFPAIWSREDEIRYHSHAIKQDQLRRYTGAK